MDSNRLKLYFHTLRKVTLTQVCYQVVYKFLGGFIKPTIGKNYNQSHALLLQQSILNPISFSSPATFLFLNLKHTFQNIDWNFDKLGKLWTYNLNYFDFLLQENISKEEGLKLIQKFCEDATTIKDGYEPYPISLRGINWIVFLNKYQIKDSNIDQQLFDDYWRLMSRIEYHILANHLFENGFSLLYGAYYFQNETFYKKAKNILSKQLETQILNDGGHYELSPMYHCIMLQRILDAYNLVSNNHWKHNELQETLKAKASSMLGWLAAIQINDAIPSLNDTTNGITPKPAALFAYAQQLEIPIKPSELKESGYRKMTAGTMDLIFDVGQIAPSYQPGHSHADSLQILLYAEDMPIIVDTGISTYEKNERRQLERSTSSHNTITINNSNSSQVWSGFRVAKRATVNLVKDTIEEIIAVHNGYQSLGIEIKRKVVSTDDTFEITDTIIGSKKEDIIEGHLHFHPNVHLDVIDHTILVNNKIEIKFPPQTIVSIKEYLFCDGFNVLIPSCKIIYKCNNLQTFTIKII